MPPEPLSAPQQLSRLASRLARECPSLRAEVEGGRLLVRRGASTFWIGPERVSSFDAMQCRRWRAEGVSYVDLRSGSVYLDEPGLFLYVRLTPPTTSRLSPYQCALLSALMTLASPEAIEAVLAGPPARSRTLVKLEVGIEISPVAMSRFLGALRRANVVREDRSGWEPAQALERLRADFRLSGVGRAADYAASAEDVANLLAEALGDRIVEGVAGVLLEKAGAWIEPSDYIVDRSALPRVTQLLGAPVPASYQGPIVRIRPSQRVPFSLLTLGKRRLQPLLAFIEAARMNSPVAAQVGNDLWRKEVARWM